MNETINKNFYCFDRPQQSVLRLKYAPNMKRRVTNRCFEHWRALPMKVKPQITPRRRAMTEAECQAVRTLTGFDPFFKEKYV